MKQLVKMQAAMLLIAMSLTSDHSASHAPIQVSEAMNQLRRVLSDLTD